MKRSSTRIREFEIKVLAYSHVGYIIHGTIPCSNQYLWSSVCTLPCLSVWNTNHDYYSPHHSFEETFVNYFNHLLHYYNGSNAFIGKLYQCVTIGIATHSSSPLPCYEIITNKSIQRFTCISDSSL